MLEKPASLLAHHGVLAVGARTEMFRLGIIHCMVFPVFITQFGSRALTARPGSPKGPWEECSTDDGEVKRMESQGVGIALGSRSSNTA